MSDYWWGFVNGALFVLFLLTLAATITSPATAAELRVVSSCRVGTWQMATATDCFNEASRQRAMMVKPGAVRFYCDGRRV